MIQQILKRDGRKAPFEIDKIAGAIFRAAQAYRRAGFRDGARSG